MRPNDESTIRYSKSGSSEIALKIRHRTPLMLHRLKRRNTLFQSPKGLWKTTPGRARTYDPQHAFYEHPVGAPG